MFGEIKARVGGTTERFWWTAPVPLATNPTLTIRHSGGDYTPTLSVVRAALDVSALDRDRKTLTLDSNATNNTGGMQGVRFGEAFLVTPQDGWFSVEVRQLDSTTVTLAEPLAAFATMDSTNTGELQWALYVATVPSTICASAERDIPWTVEYQEHFGADLTGYPQREEGVMHVVRQPFSTGLTDREILALHPGLAGRVPRRQGSWDAQRAAAQDELIIRLRADLQARGLTEDDMNGHRLRTAHAYLTAAVIYDEVQPEKAEVLRARALGTFNEATSRRTGGLVDDVLRSIWVDANQDGAVDSGEVETIEGDRAGDSASFYTGSSYDSDTRRFSRGEKH